ncbi:Gamma-tubulin complex component 4 like [Apostasia shenzhenica]|uniref:Gamma-tubulin complex component 4 like n=1 Tax=Apostasia shenzhenica TaxID=1088818 RepID=A0A2I0BE79_9ASPA|nr:Gamma-tubulin complex component 4 like [Apostasia shenzhenica]
MEVDSGFHSLLRNLKTEGPLIPPATWESIASESGVAGSIDPAEGPQDSIYELSAFSEASLVRMVINALQGVRSAVVEIEKLSHSLCCIPADRTYHRVPSLWCRSTSTNALGRMLKSICHAGFLFNFLREFVSFYLNIDHNFDIATKGESKSCLCPKIEGECKRVRKICPPYSLVNQAFAVAVGKLLEGYICSLSTLLASAKLRRLAQCKSKAPFINHGEGTLTSVVYTEITVLEVFLHTKELRTHIEALGRICIFGHSDPTSWSDGLTSCSTFEFHNFPKGAELLSYLYVQLRDADPFNHTLLKFLFVHSFMPYYGFIKLWMYKAEIDDPYEEFFVSFSSTAPNSNAGSTMLNKSFLASIKERSGVAVPTFLKDFCHLLLRAGQQLHVLLKLLHLCNISFSGEHFLINLESLREILPFWVDSSSKMNFLSCPLSFDRNGIDSLICKRTIMYRNMLEKLQNYFKKLDANARWASRTVVPFNVVPILLGSRNVENVSYSVVFDGASPLLQEDINMNSFDAHSDASSLSNESFHELALLRSSENCSSDGDNEESELENCPDVHNIVLQPSKSLFSNLPLYHANKSILQSCSRTDLECSHSPSFHTVREHIYPVTFSHQHLVNRKVDQKSAPLGSDPSEHAKILAHSNEPYQPFSCWPIGGLLKYPFFAHIQSSNSKQLCFTESSLECGNGDLSNFRCEETFFTDACRNLISDFHKSGKVQPTGGIMGSQSCQPLSYISPHAFCTNPMLNRGFGLPKVQTDGSFTDKKSSLFPRFIFSSVTDPFKQYLEHTSFNLGLGDKAEACFSGHCGTCNLGANEYIEVPTKEIVDNQSNAASFFLSEEANCQSGVQFPNAFGGAGWATLLDYQNKNAKYSSGEIHLEERFMIPLDVVIDKCILQEILFQYNYISFFTIKLLEEGFDLQEHLLALRRYYFMEISDWADLFIMLLRRKTTYFCKKCSSIEHEPKPAKIQGILELALQRSSCENDPYRERLFIHIKEQGIFQHALANGIHAFDSIVLGYRVEWPVNIVVTEDALKIYADIFSYLVQIRLAVFSLNDVWHYLKALLHLWKCDQRKNSHEMEDFNLLMRIRQQINHFTSTLQQYVQSQLSDVSWCRFQNSLKHVVKDILDLESLHMLYLADAANICFLSDDTKAVAVVMKNILQCALDFRLCFVSIGLNTPLTEKNLSYLHSHINFNEVAVVKSTFEKNLKELYILYLKSPKHDEFNLCRLWSHLNYNDYYSISINNELSQSFL